MNESYKNVTVSIRNKILVFELVIFISAPVLGATIILLGCMGEEIKFLKASIDFDILLAATKEAVELYFEGDGIPAARIDVSSENNASTASMFDNS